MPRRAKRTLRTRLRNKKLLLGVTGSVAAYKSIELARRLKDEEASVTVVMTDASKRFVTPLSFQSAARCQVIEGLFEDPMAHVELSAEADLMLVAPATANTIGKFASGIADDLLSTSFMAFEGKVVLAPAMNKRMYKNPVVVRNIDFLKSLGIIEVEPESGMLACGEEGVGRMASVPRIIETVKSALTVKDLSGYKILVTAGPTRERLDPVRFISNRSSGKMGYAVARVALRRGAEVVLVSGPSAEEPPPGVRLLGVESAEEMKDAVMGEIEDVSAVIMAAAVGDFRPDNQEKAKIAKSAIKSIKLRQNPDILALLGMMRKRPLLVGFAAEYGQDMKRAREKLLSKGADAVVFNDVSDPAAGFDVDTNRISIITKEGVQEHPLMSKEEAAWAILDLIAERLSDDGGQ